MKGLKQTVLSAAASVALLCLPITPAVAHGHFYGGGPCIVGNVIGAVATLVTLPLTVASAALSALQPQAQYAPQPGYYGGQSGNYPPPNYYAQSPAYYARPPAYYPPPQSYYRPAPGYAAPMPRYYAPTRGYYAARPSYSGSYGAPGRSVYRGW
jgi:hypothetical protein